MYTVALVAKDGSKFLGRNRTSLSQAERLAGQRLNEIHEGVHKAVGAVIIDHSFHVIANYPAPKPSRKRK